MQEYSYDYWNDADYDTVGYTAVERYEERVAELEQTIKDMETDELYILYHLIKAKETARSTLDLVAVYREIDRLIDLHGKELIAKAKLYTPRED